MANRRSIEEKLQRLKQIVTLGLAESEQLLGADRRHKWSIPDRKIAMKYLIAVKAAWTRNSGRSFIPRSGSGSYRSRRCGRRKRDRRELGGKNTMRKVLSVVAFLILLASSDAPTPWALE
jgi:hypothetical protein